ncbi:MAG: hypothetical protein Q8R63_00740 [Ramlibacter sp.]|nr:hypothetical protein [Ramlibacter sp.]
MQHQRAGALNLNKQGATFDLGEQSPSPNPAISAEPVLGLAVPPRQTSSGATPRACLPLSPLQRTTFYDKRNIAQFLTFTEATRLMRVAKDLHAALRHDPQLRLDEFSAYLQSLPLLRVLEQLHSLDCEIARLQTNALLLMMSHPRTRSAPKAPRNADQLMDAAIRAKRQERAKCQTELQFFEPELESVVLHFSAQRARGPRKGQMRSIDEIGQAISSGETLQEVLRAADATTIATDQSALLQEILSLPSRLMPNARKVQWLCQPPGVETHEAFVRSGFGLSEPLDCAGFDAYAGRIREVAASRYLDRTDKEQALTRPAGLDVFRFAVLHGNYAVAALLLLGIHESGAEPEIKDFLLAPIFAEWRGRDACLTFVTEMLARHAYRAPQWIGDVLARLNAMKAAGVVGEAPSS